MRSPSTSVETSRLLPVGHGSETAERLSPHQLSRGHRRAEFCDDRGGVNLLQVHLDETLHLPSEVAPERRHVVLERRQPSTVTPC